MRSNRPLPTALLLLALASGSAVADDQRSSVMLWASALQGTIQTGGGTANMEMSLQDILKVLDGSITLRHESLGEDRGWYAEFVINDLKRPASGALGERQVNMEQTIVEAGFTLPIAEGWRTYGGARWEQVDNSIDFSVLPTVSAGADWTDVVLGVRYDQGSDGGRWWARGDVAGGESDGAYLVEFGGALRFRTEWEISIAYRALDTNYDDAGTSVDLLQSGVVLAVSRDW